MPNPTTVVHMRSARRLADGATPTQDGGLVYHVGPANVTKLQTRSFKGTGNVFGGSGNIHRVLAPDYLWFHTRADNVWGAPRGDPLFAEDQAVYVFPVSDLPAANAKVTNAYFNCWADEENALLDLITRFRELSIDTVQQLLTTDPDFIFYDGHREGILTGRVYRERKRLKDFYDKAKSVGATLDQANDWLDGPEVARIIFEPPVERDAFSFDRCEFTTRAELEQMWKDIRSNWISANTDPFNLKLYNEYVAWDRSVLVPGPLVVVSTPKHSQPHRQTSFQPENGHYEQ